MENFQISIPRIQTEFMFCNEALRRKFCAIEALSFGRGGKSFVSSITGLSRTTIQKGESDLKSITRLGIKLPIFSIENDFNSSDCESENKGISLLLEMLLNYEKKLSNLDTEKTKGRKRLETEGRQIVYDLIKFVFPYTYYLEEEDKFFTTKSLREISDYLNQKGYKISPNTVGRILKDLNFDQSLKKNLNKKIKNSNIQGESCRFQEKEINHEQDKGEQKESNQEQNNDDSFKVKEQSSENEFGELDSFFNEERIGKFWDKITNQILYDLRNPTRLRTTGGGRSKIEEKHPEVIKEIKTELEPERYGNPEKDIVYSAKSSRKISNNICSRTEIQIKHNTVRRLIKKCGYSLQKNRKLLQVGKRHPDRNAQFKHINAQIYNMQQKEISVISVDGKNKEMIGNFANRGRTYRKAKKPHKVYDHDFPTNNLEDFFKENNKEEFVKNSLSENLKIFLKKRGLDGLEKFREFLSKQYEGKISIYGVYEIEKKYGFVGICLLHETSEFAVNTIKNWLMESKNDNKLVSIVCDGGGSNGYRGRLWKSELQKLADHTQKAFLIAHYPPGASKFNKIEHNLFNHISANWAGVPLKDINTVLNYINNTKTLTGLRAKSILDTKLYEIGIKVDDQTFKSVNIYRYQFRPEWNYLICPTGKNADNYKEYLSDFEYKYEKKD